MPLFSVTPVIATAKATQPVSSGKGPACSHTSPVIGTCHSGLVRLVLLISFFMNGFKPTSLASGCIRSLHPHSMYIKLILACTRVQPDAVISWHSPQVSWDLLRDLELCSAHPSHPRAHGTGPSDESALTGQVHYRLPGLWQQGPANCPHPAARPSPSWQRGPTAF